MNYYGILFSSFWDGPTGRALADEGGKDAQLVALNLTSCKVATMIGIFPIRIADIAVDIRTLTPRQVEAALEVLARPSVGFAEYDKRTEHVWVRQMAWFRLGLHKGPMAADDNRAKGAKRLYENLRPNPFLSPFFDHYRKLISGLKRRDYDGETDPPAPTTTTSRASKGVRRGSGGASKPENRSGSVNRSGSERTGEQDQGEGTGAAGAATLTPAAFFAGFSLRHEARLKTPAIFKPDDEGKIAPQLAVLPADIIERCLDAFFSSSDRFIKRAGFTVPVFISQLASLIAQTADTSKAFVYESPTTVFAREFPRGLPPGWQDECIQLHGGICSSGFIHWQKKTGVIAS